ncbi:MAG: hypothetical protein PHZ23_14655 [Acidiphilium sp.]|nr:hypothetical protein [Acidiphilium sp.]
MSKSVDIGSIEKGVPMPALKRGARRSRYPFEQMAIGDSFVVTGLTVAGVRSQCVAAKAKGLGSFKIAVEEDKIRIWRVS